MQTEQRAAIVNKVELNVASATVELKVALTFSIRLIASSLDLEMVESTVDVMGRTPDVDAGYAYLIDGGQTAALAALSDLKDRGFRAAMTLDPTRVGGHELASGSVVLRVGQNDDTLHTAVREVADHFGLEVLAVGTGLSEPGLAGPGMCSTGSTRSRSPSAE